MTNLVPARTWHGDPWTNGPTRNLVIETTEHGDARALISIYHNGDGPGVLLDARQIREIAADLTARADLMETR